MGKPLRRAIARLKARRLMFQSGTGRKAPGSQNRHKSMPHKKRK